MSNLTVFEFESNKVRFVEGKPVANDVAKVLGYANPSKTISTKVSPKNKGLTEMVTPGGVQSVTVLEEAGIYQLIFSSKLDSAQEFQDWVFEEVLPQIRKTGSYYSQPQPQRCLTFAEKLEGVREVENLMGNFATQHPRLAQELTDVLMNELKGQRLLIGSSEPVLRGVVEIAEEMGYRAHDLGIRSTLGKFVKKMVGHLSQYEKRLCNGTMKDINCYPDTPEVRDAIAKFFS